MIANPGDPLDDQGEDEEGLEPDVADVLEERRTDAFTFERYGYENQANIIIEIVQEVEGALTDYLRFIDEASAMELTGRSLESLRKDLAIWKKRGHVREEKGGALRYRALLLGLILRKDNDDE
jgi:hypothetical protein